MKRQLGKLFLLALASAGSLGTVVHAGGSPRALRAEPSSKKMADPGRIFGFVTDPQGAVVPRADVSLTNPVTESHRQTATNGQGYFEFNSVEPGDYRLAVTALGFVEVTKDISVAPGEAVHADVMFVKLSDQAQQVTVVATSPDI